MEIDINNLPDGWRVEEGRKRSQKTGKKRLFILNEVGKCVGASCGKCGAVLEVEYFCNSKKGRYGKESICKYCKTIKSKEWWSNNKEKGAIYALKYRTRNPIKAKESTDTWRKNNPEKLKESNKKSYRKRYLNNPEYFHKYSKKYYEENKNKVIEYRKQWVKENREKYLTKKHEYYLNNKGKYKIYKHIRRARAKASGGFYTDAQLKECLEFFNGCCAYTGEQLGSYDLDHIQPISKGGTSFIYNLVPATATANRSKGAKDLEEWYKEQEYYSQERLNKILEWQEIAFKMFGTNEQGEV